MLWLLCRAEDGEASYSGRATTGGFVALETSQNPADSVTSNNSAVVSNRIFAETAGQDYEGAVDLRDKNDFFGRLDAERLRLTPSSVLQIYQLYARAPGEPGQLFGSLGRFVLSETGGRFVDGAELGYRCDSKWRVAAFGGLNPKREDQTSVTFNSAAQIFGANLVFQPDRSRVLTSASWASALLGELTSSHLDRFYWHNNATWAWNGAGQLFVMTDLDFQPRLELQNALLSVHQALTSIVSADASLTAVDVIEYTRRQGFFETLSSSAYREASVNLRAAFERAAYLDTQVLYGARQADGLTRTEFSTGPSLYKLAGDRLSVRMQVGGGRNFTGDELFGRAGASWFASSWEVDLTSAYSFSKDSVVTLHEWSQELAVARDFSRRLFAQASLEAAWDERVTIWAASARLSYLFGDKGRAPLVDRAPRPEAPLPAGRL